MNFQADNRPNPFRKLLLLGICLFSAVSMFAQGTQEQIVDGIAAVVEDEIILVSDIQQYAQMQAMQMGINPYQNPQQFQQAMQRLQPQVLESLISQKIIQAKAEEDSVIIKDHEIEQTLQQQIDQMAAQAGGEEAMEEQLGMSVSQIKNEYREDVRKRLLVERYQATKFSNIAVSRNEIEQFYRTYKDSIPAMPERVNISHILLQVKPDQSADSAAVEQLRDIRRQLEAGAGFDSLATRYSQDPGSGNRGGDLGFVSRGTLVPGFEEAAFALREGEISDVVHTEFGYHLIKLVERRGERIHVKHILRKPEATETDTRLVRDQLNTLRQQALNGTNFDSLAQVHSEDEGVEMNSGNLGWYEIPNLRIEAFKNAVDTLQPGEITRPFRSEFGWHIVKMNDRKPGGEVTLKDHWTELEQMVMQRKLNSLRKQFYVEVKIDTVGTGVTL